MDPIQEIACSFAMWVDRPEGGLFACWFYYQADAPVDPEVAVVDIWDHLSGPFAFPISPFIEFYGMNIRDALADFETADSFFYEAPAQPPRAFIDTFLPLNDAVVIQRRADLVDRKKWGRIFLPGVAYEACVNPFHCEVAMADGTGLHPYLQNLADAMLEPISTTGAILTPCLHSKKLGALLPLVWTGVQPRLCTMRKRNPIPWVPLPE